MMARGDFPKWALLLSLLGAISNSPAETASTVPVGVVTVTIQGSPNGTAHAITPISAPLLPAASITGLAAGHVTAVTASTIGNSSAGWVTGALSQPESPCYVRIKSGAAEGQMFRISANTQTDLTVVNQDVDLMMLGLVTGVQGDTYEIVMGDTLLSLFGTPADGIVGGSSAAFSAQQTDKVLVNDATGALLFFYYDTAAGSWKRLGSGANQNTLPIAPWSGLFYYRIAQSGIDLELTGTVPDTSLKKVLAVNGSSIVSTYFPVDMTLSSLGLQSLGDWRKLGDAGVTLQTTDRVVFKHSTGAIFSAYYDAGSSAWKRVGSGADLGVETVSAGSAVILTRFGSGSPQIWDREMPYNLQVQ